MTERHLTLSYLSVPARWPLSPCPHTAGNEHLLSRGSWVSGCDALVRAAIAQGELGPNNVGISDLPAFSFRALGFILGFLEREIWS